MSHLAGYVVDKMIDEVGDKVKSALGIEEEEEEKGFFSMFKSSDKKKKKEEEDEKDRGGLFSFGDKKEKDDDEGGFFSNLLGKDDDVKKASGFKGLFSEQEGGGEVEWKEPEGRKEELDDGGLMDDLLEVAKETSGGD